MHTAPSIRIHRRDGAGYRPAQYPPILPPDARSTAVLASTHWARARRVRIVYRSKLRSRARACVAGSTPATSPITPTPGPLPVHAGALANRSGVVQDASDVPAPRRDRDASAASASARAQNARGHRAPDAHRPTPAAPPVAPNAYADVPAARPG